MEQFDFIVVGSGAGGGVLAARLARNELGLKVLLIEAGADPSAHATYQVPGFHALATEDEAFRWDYFVAHFTDRSLARSDPKCDRDGRGIFYPRASALGGCTAHHAMITVCPDNSDWDQIAAITGDNSWSSEKMWPYFERCSDVRRAGWLPVSAADPIVALDLLKDPVVSKILAAALVGSLPSAVTAPLRKLIDAAGALPHIGQLAHTAFRSLLGHQAGHVLGDTNLQGRLGSREGVYRIPTSIKDGRRHGVTEFLLATRDDPTYGKNLTILTGCLVTRVTFANGRATGVEYLPRARAYRADRATAPGDQRPWETARRELKTATATREVILAAGAFNTPQILMHSGIGAERDLQLLEKADLGFERVATREGVGQNLQDRYEIAVIDEHKNEFSLLDGYTFDDRSADKGLEQWGREGGREGLYTTNGGTIAIMKRSQQQTTKDCDLFIFGIPSEFGGYQLDYSKRVRSHDGRRRFSWVILKAHTENAGTIHLRSADPRDPPLVNFCNFGDGKLDGRDLAALQEGVEFVRTFMNPLRSLSVTSEVVPGIDIEGTKLAEFIRTNAWGHHASCSCKMSVASDAMAVVDSEFRVFGVREGNLRIVDASVFPKIPGYFIVLPTYMIAEKAADVILREHGA